MIAACISEISVIPLVSGARSSVIAACISGISAVPLAYRARSIVQASCPQIFMIKNTFKLEKKRGKRMFRCGMPTLIETETLEECAALCRELELDFIELNMNLPGKL